MLHVFFDMQNLNINMYLHLIYLFKLDLFYVLAIVNSEAVNLDEQLSLWYVDLESFGRTPKSVRDGLHSGSIFKFFEAPPHSWRAQITFLTAMENILLSDPHQPSFSLVGSYLDWVTYNLKAF